jgi:hypothetical protein
MDLDPWAAVSSVTTSVMDITDSKMAQLQAARKALMLLQSASSETDIVSLCLAAADGDTDKLLDLMKNPEVTKLLSEQDNSGLFPLTYAVVFGNGPAAALLLNKSTEALNTPDGLFGYTPLMWAVYCNRKEIAVELLNFGSDPNIEAKNGLTVFDLLKPGSEMYDFFEEHGLLKDSLADSQKDDSDFYKGSDYMGNQDEELIDKIRLQTAGLNIGSENHAGLYQDSDAFVNSTTLLGDEFNFSKLLKNQYIIFSDYDIPAILDLIFTLNADFNHKTTYPAAVIYQCVRYADHMKDNDVLVENFLNLAFTKIRSNTASKTGVTSVYSEGDIVLQSYWLSVMNFLFYYLSRDDGFFKRHPKVLQDIITTFQSLMIELANSIKFRLNNMVDDCLLNYTSIPDITTTLYKNDWNFFKKKHHPKSTYEEIFQMLYPPSVKEQQKPSPIKVIQTFGALLYVLDLHSTHPLLTQQTLSIVFYWLGCTLFNRIISQKKHLSRAKAIQIRLNISVIEDWARSNDRCPQLPDMDEDLLKLFPYTLLEDNLESGHSYSLRNVAFYQGDASDTKDAAFFHSGLYSIVKIHLEPTFELLQWLQCLSGIKDEEGLTVMIGSLQKLNVAQMWKVMDRYRYEVGEESVEKRVRKSLEKKAKKENNAIKDMSYSSQDLIHLNQDQQFLVALPTVLEMVNEYGAGLGGIHKERAIKFQPFLPVQILDAIDEIHEQKTTRREQENEEEVQRVNDDFEGNIITYDDEQNGIAKDDELFGQLSAPSTLAHRNWGDENEMNPW